MKAMIDTSMPVDMDKEIEIINQVSDWARGVCGALYKQMEYLENQSRITEKGTSKAKSIEIYYNLLSDAYETTQELVTACRVIKEYIYRNRYLETEYLLNKEKTDLRAENSKLRSEVYQLEKFINIQRESIANMADRIYILERQLEKQ
ncbi:MAG: hypothetical protein RML94_02630 [Bacteroidia bacterium]|nr:hypothetical protein [Bacteroidia bacterium]